MTVDARRRAKPSQPEPPPPPLTVADLKAAAADASRVEVFVQRMCGWAVMVPVATMPPSSPGEVMRLARAAVRRIGLEQVKAVRVTSKRPGFGEQQRAFSIPQGVQHDTGATRSG